MKGKKINYLSLASVISAFAVVMLHTNGVFWRFSTERYWVTANIIESVMYFAVPVFFMISGATLIDYGDKYSTREFFKKRISKTFIPFLVWSILGVIYTRAYMWGIHLPKNFEEVKEIILLILNVKPVNVYWFFVPLFGIYLCIPLFSAIQKDLKVSIFKYMVAVTFIFNILIPFLCSVFQFGYTNRISVVSSSGYLFYVLIGYILSREKIVRKWRLVSYFMGIIGLLLHIVGTYYLSMDAAAIVSTYKGYTNLPCVLYSIAIFIFIKEIGERIKSEKVWNFINWASKYTFAVYLMHWFVMDILKRVFAIDVYSIAYRLGAPVVVCGICILVTWLLRKLQIGKTIIP